MSPSPRGRAKLAALVSVTVAATVAPVVGLASPAHADTTSITILDINDYHGRVQPDGTGTNDASTYTPMELATTIEGIRDTEGDENVAFISAGDNIGASLFNSSFADDQPTIDVLNAIGLQSTVVGNHEFDKGWPWYRRHVIKGTDDYRPADFPSIGANVYEKGTENPVLDEYAVVPVGGLDMCVIGAITQETPSLVSPNGIRKLDFGDPVEAVNRVAAELDGTDTCDITVATYHEGAGAGTPDGATIEEEVAAGGPFAEIVTETDASVDAIFTGHTHKEYAWTYAKPGGEGTRPVVQTGSYGAKVGRVDLSYDSETGDVALEGDPSLVTVGTAEATGNPVVDEVAQITADAVEKANVVGDVAEGEVTDDITTAFVGGTYGPDGYQQSDPTKRDDRLSESALGNLVAQALKTPITGGPDLPKPDIGVVNPGGLRNELYYEGDLATSDQNGDGVVTYEEAVAVLPFANDVNYVRLTGAEFVQVLEQQWQTTADGTTRPSRPFLHLGLSRNVSVTLEPDTSATSPVGDNVHTVMVDGEPIDPDKTYVVSTFSFLAQGGDNFRAFKQGEVIPTGKIDRDLWIEDFLAESDPLTPRFDRRQVFVDDVPEVAQPGDEITIAFQKLNLTSLGAPANETMTASYVADGSSTELATTDVATDGSATVSFTVPADAVGGRVEIVAEPSGTTVTVPLPKQASSVDAAVRPAKVVRGKTTPRLVATVSGEGDSTPSGRVRFTVGGETYAAALEDGKATVRVGPFKKTGKKTVKVVYAGGDSYESSSTTTTFRVVKKK